MARYSVLAASIALLAPLLCIAAVFFLDPISTSLLSIGSASPAVSSAVQIPQPLSLQPAVSGERALESLPLWHGRLDEDVMANPPPPFFARAPFAQQHPSLRSPAQFLSNHQVTARGGPHDSYAAMKAQYAAQQRRTQRIEKGVEGVQRAASAAQPLSHHVDHSAREHMGRALPQDESLSRGGSPYAYSHAGFVRDTSFYKGANSATDLARFDSNLASTIRSRDPRLANDLVSVSSAISRRFPPQRPSSPHPPAQLSSSSAHHPSASVVATPVASLRPLLPASLRRKLMPHDTSFYQAANSRAGIARFDAHLASQIQLRRPGLSQDLKRISAFILSGPLSSITPLLPAPSPTTALATPHHSPSVSPAATSQHRQPAQPSVTFEHRHQSSDYNRIFQKHATPSLHFPQQEEAWIHFAASGASFGGDTKEQREAVKKVCRPAARALALRLRPRAHPCQVRTLARQFFKEGDGVPALAKAAAKSATTVQNTAPLLAT
jgi:hypothetical protein